MQSLGADGHLWTTPPYYFIFTFYPSRTAQLVSLQLGVLQVVGLIPGKGSQSLYIFHCTFYKIGKLIMSCPDTVPSTPLPMAIHCLVM